MSNSEIQFNSQIDIWDSSFDHAKLSNVSFSIADPEYSSVRIYDDSSTTAAQVKFNGDVFIDWGVVEKLANSGPQLGWSAVPICQLLLAVRDGTWKEFEKKE